MRRVVSQCSGNVSILFFQSAFAVRAVVAKGRQRRVRAQNPVLARSAPSREEHWTVMAEFQLEGFGPGFALCMMSIGFRLVYVDPVNAAASEAVLMRMRRLKYLHEPD